MLGKALVTGSPARAGRPVPPPPLRFRSKGATLAQPRPPRGRADGGVWRGHVLRSERSLRSGKIGGFRARCDA